MSAHAASVTATYSAVAPSPPPSGSADKIRYHPRMGHSGRMVNGVFEGTNGDPVSGPYTLIHTVASNPAAGWNEVQVSLGGYRYLRYRSPKGGFCNVAEVEFYRGASKVAGAGFGSAGSYSGQTSDGHAAALDGNISTDFDSTQTSGAYVGIDTSR